MQGTTHITSTWQPILLEREVNTYESCGVLLHVPDLVRDWTIL